MVEFKYVLFLVTAFGMNEPHITRIPMESGNTCVATELAINRAFEGKVSGSTMLHAWCGRARDDGKKDLGG